MGFVCQELLQLIERPTAQIVILFSILRQVGFLEANAGQIFKYEKRVFAVFLDECLRNLMIHIGHPTVLSSRNGFEFTLNSPTLRASLDRIKDADVERAGDVYSFYSDLDASICSVAKKTRSGGYQFWVVGNRTVKNELLQTDVIITELAPQYGLTPVYTIDRNIPNKVMPAQNSPTNISGAKGSTMTMEHIIVLRKN